MRSRLVWVWLLAACSSRPPSDGEVAAVGPAAAPVVAAAPGVPVTAPADAPEDGPARVRAEFAAALAKVRPGMTDAQVRGLLGAPDDVRTERDPGGITAARTTEVWRWGTNGHLSFGTLGTVHVQADHKVQHVFGGQGGPAAGLPDEAALRRLLRRLAAVSSYNGRGDPLRIVQAVNALQPLGKPTALAVIDEFLRVASPFDDPGRDGVFLVVRVLFDAPPGQDLPPMRVGAPSPTPADERALPRFPLVLVDDIPLSVTHGYALGGLAEQPHDHLAWYRTHGLLRAAALRPPDAPLAAIERAFAPGSPLARAAAIDDDAGRALIYDQALQLLDSVVRAEPDRTDTKFAAGPDSAARWQTARAEVDRLGIVWDAARDLYTLAGGRVLPPRPAPRPRALWDAPVPGASSARVALEWRGAQLLDVEVRIAVDKGRATPPAQLRLVDAASGAQLAALALARLAAPGHSTAGMSTSTRIEARPGVRLRAELVVDGEVVASQLLDP